MILVPDEMLMAYADGELAPEEAQALEAHLARDAALRARLAPFIVTRTELASVFAPTLHEPVPARLIAAVTRRPLARHAPAPGQSAAERVRDALVAIAAAAFPAGLSLATAASVAGLLAVGAAGGWLVGRADAPSGVFEVAGQTVVATGTLAHALEAAPSRSGDVAEAFAEGATVVPVVSFRTASDGVCREYRMRGATAETDFAGLACRAADGAWRVVLNVETPAAPRTPPTPGESYGTATGLGVPAVDALVETIIEGPAFGGNEESAYLRNGWRTPPASN